MISSIKTFIFCGAVLCLATVHSVFAQQGHSHTEPVLQAISQAYEHGQLTIDESILYKFYAAKSPSKLPPAFQSDQPKPIKCGTPLFVEFRQNRDRLSLATINEIEAMTTSRRPSQTFTSASGNFLIHYETSGNDAVPTTDTSGVNGIPDYVEFVAAAADSSWRYQVQQLGFTNPFLPSTQYDVTITNLGPGFYGLTRSLGNTTEIEIHNNFLNGFPPNDHPDGNQIGDINVTMAHEFKHAIQFANNQWQGSAGSFGWSEMDATLMEEVTYDNVNDYYNYLFDNVSIFLDPGGPIPGAYWDVSFSIFLDEFFGTQFWVDVWVMEIKPNPTMNFLDAIINQTEIRNRSFPLVFAESYLWHYASGPNNAAPDYGFDERNNYPDPAISETINGIQQSLNSPPAIDSQAANYFRIDPFGNEPDQVLITVSSDNSSYAAGAIAYFKNGSTDVIFGARSNPGTLRLETPWAWGDVDDIGLVTANSSQTENATINVGTASYVADLVTLEQNFPNPFSASTTIKFTLSQDSNAQLKLFDITGRLVRTILDGQRTAGTYTSTLSSDRLASGVYFYQLVTDQRSRIRKLTLIK